MRGRVVQPDGLGALGKARRDRNVADEKFRREILFAHLDGSSLRAIAEVARLSPESVRTIIREENAKREEARLRLERPMTKTFDDFRSGEPGARRRLARDWRLSVQELDT